METVFNSQFHFCPQSCSLIIQVGDDLQRPVVGSDWPVVNQSNILSRGREIWLVSIFCDVIGRKT